MSCRPGPAVRVLVIQALAALLLLPLTVERAHAQAGDGGPGRTFASAVVAVDFEAPGDDATDSPSGIAATPLPHRVVTPIAPARPSLLLPLYMTFGALQALDAHSTMRALDNGGREANPVVAPFGRNAAALVAMKAATTAGTIVLAEKLRRSHPVKAMVMMTAVNVAYAAIVAANYRR
jgi:hypothetical protein